MFDEKLLKEYWSIEQQKTNLAASNGMTLQRFMMHLMHVDLASVRLIKSMIRRQLTLLRLMRVADRVENVIFVQFKPGDYLK